MKYLRKYFAVLTGLFVFLIYLTTLAPSVVEIDSGELATVQATLGIAHPTGYPLFTLIGHLFSLFPLPFTKIYGLNLLTAIWCSLAAGLFTYTSKIILDNISSFSIADKTKVKSGKKDKSRSNAKEKTDNLPELKKYLAAVFGGLALAFSKTFWTQGTSVEVYSLHVFLMTLVIFFLIKAYLVKDRIEHVKLLSAWTYFAAALALAFSNHMTSILILPGIAYLYFEKYGLKNSSIKRVFYMLIFFIPILLLLYAYLPIRASQNPILNWGYPTDPAKIFRHVSGSQYRVWLFSSTAAAAKQFSYFVNNLPAEFLASSFIILFGLYYSFMHARKMFYFLLITFAATVSYSINYDIHDIDSYFLLAYIALGFFSVFGSVALMSILKNKRYVYSVPAVLITMFIAAQIFINYKDVNESDTYSFKDYTKAVLNSVPKGSIIFTYEWDYLVSPSYYFQYVERYRQDVTVVDKELLRRSWYYHQLNTDHPFLLSGMTKDVDNFKTAVAPFESGGNFNPALLETYYRKVMTDLVATNIDKHDFYVAPELFENEMQKGEFTLPRGYTLVPGLFLFKVVKGNNYIPAPDPDYTIRLPHSKNKYILNIERFAGSMLVRRALYEMQYDKVERARLYIKKLKQTFPDYIIPRELDQVLE